MPTTLTRPLVTPVLDSRPSPRPWPTALTFPTPPAGLQPALDLRRTDDLGAVTAVLDPDTAVPPGLPDARAWSRALATTVLEVLAGRRPAAQLSRWLAADVLDGLARCAPRRRPSMAAPAPALRSGHVQHPAVGVAEVAVHGRLDAWSVPLALRLEARASRWLGTALELGPLP